MKLRLQWGNGAEDTVLEVRPEDSVRSLLEDLQPPASAEQAPFLLFDGFSLLKTTDTWGSVPLLSDGALLSPFLLPVAKLRGALLSFSAFTVDEHAAFVNVSGKIDNVMVGVTIFGFPENIRYPQAIRVHPVMPYWAYTPVVDGAMVIPPGESLTSRFRIYVYDGPAGESRNKDILTDIQNPVQVRLK